VANSDHSRNIGRRLTTTNLNLCCFSQFPPQVMHHAPCLPALTRLLL